MDWCNSQGEDIQTTYASMSKALNESGRAIHFNMCEWGKENPWEWGDKVAQSWRMSGDHTGVWSSTKAQIASTAAIPPSGSGRPFGWNDMDMLETGNYDQAAHANNRESNMTAEEYMTEFSMWAIAASPLTVTTPIMNCSQGRRHQNVPNGGLRFIPQPDLRAPDETCNVTLTKQVCIRVCACVVERGVPIICCSDSKKSSGRRVLFGKPVVMCFDFDTIVLFGLSQTSHAACTLGVSFGCNETEKSMWTNNGCRGLFGCDGYATT